MALNNPHLHKQRRYQSSVLKREIAGGIIPPLALSSSGGDGGTPLLKSSPSPGETPVVKSRRLSASLKTPRLSAKKRRAKGLPLLCLILFMTLLLCWGYMEIKSQLEQPQAILVLGGSVEREKFAAEFALQHPDVQIWISGGSPKDYAQKIFTKAGVKRDRLHLDYQAVDTVTNFTTLVEKFQACGIKKLYLITSDYHMRRASVIGQIVLGSRGIDFTPISVPSERSSPESIKKSIRDGARAVLWVVTGHTGSTLTKKLGTLKN